MRLYVLRHGQAEGFAATDAQRALTSKGVSDVCALADILKDIEIDTAVISPYLRTRQTFTYIAQRSQFSINEDVNQRVASGASLSEVMSVLEGYQSHKNLLFVNHQPLVSSLVSMLVEGTVDHAYMYPMQPASLAVVDLSAVYPACGQCLKLIHPPYT